MENEVEFTEDSLTSQNDDDTSESVENVEESDLSLEEKTAKLAETNKKLFARAKKAEQELKAFKQSSVEVKTPEVQKPKVDEDIVDKRVNEILEERELDAMEISDNSKNLIRAYAKANSISIRKAVRSDYYDFLTQKETSAKQSEDASIGGKRTAPSSTEFSLDNPPKVDIFTEEGRKTYEEYEQWRKSQK